MPVFVRFRYNAVQYNGIECSNAVSEALTKVTPYRYGKSIVWSLQKMAAF